jgi:adenylate cyclase
MKNGARSRRVWKPQRRVLLAGLLPTLVVTTLSVWHPGWLSRVHLAAYDTLVRRAPTRPPAGQVVIVDVDERSLSTLGQWPWRRDLIGRLIAGVRDLGASVVAVDMVFAEPDRFEPSPLLVEDAAGPAAMPPAASDGAFADLLRPGRVVLGYAMTFDDRPAGSGPCVLHALGLATIRRDPDLPHEPFFQASGAICNLPVLAEAAGRSGFLNAAPDADGVLRRVPLLIELDGLVQPGLALAAVAAFRGVRDVALRVANANSTSLMLGDAVVPLDGRSQLLVRYRGQQRTFRYVSAADVLGGRLPAGSFDRTIVFVGTTALGTREVVATPLDTLFAGVEVQATVADNLLQRDFLHRPEHAALGETLAVIVIGLLAAIVVRSERLALSVALMAASGAFLWAGSLWLLETGGLYLSPVFPTLGLLSALGAMTVTAISTERQRADREGQERTRSQHLMVKALLSLTETRDAETGRHARRTQQYAKLLAEELARHPRFHRYLTSARVGLLSSLAPLHDIGKVGVPDHVLNKPGKLTPDEQAEMRKHPEYGRDVILRAEREADVYDDETLAIAKEIVYTHHERWDGTGYPKGLRGDDIPIPGRLMAVVDVYDAAISRRVYSDPMSFEQVVSLIEKGRGTHFDPAVVDAFLRVEPAMRRVTASLSQ